MNENTKPAQAGFCVSGLRLFKFNKIKSLEFNITTSIRMRDFGTMRVLEDFTFEMPATPLRIKLRDAVEGISINF